MAANERSGEIHPYSQTLINKYQEIQEAREIRKKINRGPIRGGSEGTEESNITLGPTARSYVEKIRARNLNTQQNLKAIAQQRHLR